MPIRAERIQRDIDAVARFTQTPGQGRSCPTFSAEWRQARAMIDVFILGLVMIFMAATTVSVRCRSSIVDERRRRRFEAELPAAVAESRANNFDALRLLAAASVVFFSFGLVHASVNDLPLFSLTVTSSVVGARL